MFKVSSAIRGFLLGFRVCCGVGDWGPHAWGLGFRLWVLRLLGLGFF